MDGFLQGALGGLIPAALMLIVYFLSLSSRLARIETDISWLKKVLESCLPLSKNRTP